LSKKIGDGSLETFVAAAAEGFGEAAESMETLVMISLLVWPPLPSGAEACACGFSLPAS
jgi:hypothetical protein